ncbi:MAG: hypothetical protein HQL47_11505, partial [Gammaproteobacteria bacterium]|nr:hypothetical protein [Gammaproteobacteria bacterium]
MTEWKDKYLKLSDQHDAEVERCAESERLLCRAIVRMTIAVKGLDQRLDPHLLSLQKAAKSGAATPAFQHRLSELSDALVKASEEKSTQGPDLLGRLVRNAALKGGEQKQLEALYQRLAEHPERATPQELDQLLQLLAPAAGAVTQTEAPASKPGLFGRLLGGKEGSGAAQSHQPQPNQQLQALLQRLEWPTRMRDDLRLILARLGSDSGNDQAWLRVVEEISGLLSGNLQQVERDLEETERFLAGLNGRLQELDAVLQRMDIARDRSAESGRALQEAMVKEVDGVNQVAEEATDLGDFKRQLSKRLDVIKIQVVHHLQQEQQRFNESAQESEQMRARMRELEDESEKLRRTLAEAQNQATTDALTGIP